MVGERHIQRPGQRPVPDPVDPCHHSGCRADSQKDPCRRRKDAQRGRFLQEYRPDLRRRRSHTGQDAELTDLFIHKNRKRMVDDQNQGKARAQRRPRKNDQYRVHIQGIRAVRVDHEKQIQQVFMIGHIPGVQSRQRRNLRKVFIRGRCIPKTDIRRLPAVFRDFPANPDALHIGIALYSFYVLFRQRPRQPRMIISILRLHSHHIIIPEIIKYAAQKRQEQRRDQYRDDHRHAGSPVIANVIPGIFFPHNVTPVSGR